MLRVTALIAVLACACDCYRILVMFPFPGRSHSILGYGHVDRLLKAGHEVTFVTPFPRKNNNPNLKLIDVSELTKLLPEELSSLEKILDKTTDAQNFTRFLQILTDVNELTFHHENVQAMLNDDAIKFDAVIVEWMMSEFSSSYAAYYDVPLIYFASTDPHSLVLRLMDEAPSSAYAPTVLSSEFPPFNFVQRVKELFLDIFLHGFNELLVYRREAALYDQTIAPMIAKKGRTPPPFSAVKYNASLMLGNSHVSLGSAIRLPQSFKPIGGFHIDETKMPLTDELKKIMDSAKHGVIYFSMGSNLKSKFLPKEMKSDLLKLFGSLKQTVIWKFEEALPNLPKNVFILQWAPQPSILAHPNTILFITHGGLLSTTETIHFGVPTIGIPVFADQFTNVDRSVKKGFALRVDLTYSLVEDLKVAIGKFLSDPTYSQKAKELSMVYHDRPVPPGQELVHWVEHVVKTRGAPHLRSPALSIPWYQKMYLDLLALVLLTVILIKKLITCLCCGKKVDLKKKRN